MTFPDPPIPTEEPLAPIPDGDGSTFLWGGTFLPIAKETPPPFARPEWAANYGFLLTADPARFFLIDFFVWALDFAL